ncbi:ATP-grasp domain-containing protein [Candidatus Saccharibacteria bacterium]|nr:ATP-grasp domain-containing protein [Candidatus Saccharibacteria bacterium]
MRIGILSAELDDEALVENQRLADEIEDLGHQSQIINYHRTYSYIDGTGALYEHLADGSSRKIEVDAVIPRINEADPLSITGGVSALRTLVLSGVYSPSSPEAVDLVKNKFNSQLVMAAAGVPTPRSVMETSTVPTYIEEILTAIEPDAEKSVIIKSNVGTHGIGVELTPNRTLAIASLTAHPPAQSGMPTIIQELIDSNQERPADIRLITIGKKVMATMKRVAAEGEFRSNIAQGGTGVAYEPSEREIEVAEAASEAVNSDILGIDIMFLESEPVVIEVNISPGFHVEKVSGVNVPRLMAQLAIKNALKL